MPQAITKRSSSLEAEPVNCIEIARILRSLDVKREIPIGSAPAEKSELESKVCPEHFRLGGFNP